MSEKLRVHAGVLYERESPKGFWYPATGWSLKHYQGDDVPEAKIDPTAPLLCDCGSVAFNVISPPSEYRTSARCLECGVEEVVHDE